MHNVVLMLKSDAFETLLGYHSTSVIIFCHVFLVIVISSVILFAGACDGQSCVDADRSDARNYAAGFLDDALDLRLH
jgi:hypothetical protein